MKRGSRVLRDELLYVIHSKAWLLLLVALAASVCLTMWNTNGGLRGAYAQYEYAREDARSNGQNPDAMLLAPVHTKVTDVHGTQVTESDNPVRLAADGVTAALLQLAPQRLIPISLGAMMLLVGTLAFSAWGVFFGTYDYTNGTVKVKAVKASWAKIVLAKLAVNALSVSVILGFVFAFTAVAATAVHYYVLNYELPNASVFLSATTSPVPQLLVQYLVCFLVGTLFSSIGIALGVLCKKPYPALATVVIYNLFVPVLGAYDLKNVVAVVMRRVFSFDEGIKVIAATPIHLAAAYSVILVLIFLSAIVSVVTAQRQTKFVAF